MRKMLLSFTTAGVLAVPVGVVAASQYADAVDPEPAVTVVSGGVLSTDHGDGLRTRERAELHVGTTAQVRQRAEQGDGTQVRERTQMQERTQVQDPTGTIEQERDQIRDRVRLMDGSCQDGTAEIPDRDRVQDRLQDRDQVRDPAQG